MQPYVPNVLPLTDLNYRLLLPLVGQANAALALLRQLKEAGILRELQRGSGRRAATLCFPQLLNVVEGREAL